MNVYALIVPLLFILTFVYAAIKKVKIYDSFTSGIKGAFPLVLNIFPYIAAIFMLTELFEQSGLSARLCDFLAPALRLFGIPKEIIKLLLIKPFSGSGATALLTELLEQYGADSYVCRCAAVCYGSSETVFYVAAVYFSAVSEKKPAAAIVIALFASFVAAVVGCLLCRIL